jgi:tetratricopeptide (TPR) repeat protein
MDLFARGYAALRRGDRATTDSLLRALGATAGVPAVADRYSGNPDVPTILEQELRASIRAADGATDEAVTLLRQAAGLEAALPLEFGPPDVAKPTHELLGELLLSNGKPAEAQQEFTRALSLTPRRSLSLLGLARSATAAGDTAVASQAWTDLRTIWRAADPDAPGLDEVTKQSARAQ